MASILNPFNVVNPGPFSVPTGELFIDWSNPLTNGLIGCWVPGLSMGPADILNLTPLTMQSAASFDTSKEGIGLKSVATASGMTVLAPQSFKVWTTGFTLYWRGQLLGVPPSFANFIGITYDNADSSPYHIAEINGLATGTGTIQNNWNFAGTAKNLNFLTAFPAANIMFSIGATYVVGGATPVTNYRDGSADGTIGFGGTAPNSTATSTFSINNRIPTTGRYANAICNMACVWNRALSAAEMAGLDRAPYSFLIPAEYDLPILKTVAAPSTIFRKSASKIGTRTGTRQTWAA